MRGKFGVKLIFCLITVLLPNVFEGATYDEHDLWPSDRCERRQRSPPVLK